ncbi:hypothetical protein LWI28_008895 [Acer negundo]|uniref:PGG domain-containing protein n=1 Tax=Acer negundo TaxID=4023 RepID=A0AAD5IY96_ACENE|nr:hypothetical protein LWI28_008895 [Acer negundo]
MLHDHHEIVRNDDIKRLYVAAFLGNAGDLTQLLNENIDLLEDVLLTRADTPLHIVARFGHLNFVRTVLIHKPSLAWELNHDGFSAMHERKLLQPGTADDHQVQQKHEMLIAATLIMSLAIFLFGSSWTQQTYCQLDKKQLRLDQESMLFHLQVMFNLFGVVSAAYVIILVLTGIEKWET